MWLVLTLVLSAHPSTGERACGSCHQKQQKEFDASAHGHVFTNPLFQLSWTSTRSRGWCLSCHAETGMTCASCHVGFGKVGEAKCASCHQFNAPEAQFAAVAMQNTFEEWKASGAKETCAQCHFNGSHLSLGGHDVALLQKTLSVKWNGACATVTANGAGHAVPTGDPFHHLVLQSCADAECTQIIERKALIRRVLTLDDGGVTVLGDSRPFPSSEVCFSSAPKFHRLVVVHAESHLKTAPTSELMQAL